MIYWHSCPWSIDQMSWQLTLHLKRWHSVTLHPLHDAWANQSYAQCTGQHCHSTILWLSILNGFSVVLYVAVASFLSSFCSLYYGKLLALLNQTLIWYMSNNISSATTPYNSLSLMYHSTITRLSRLHLSIIFSSQITQLVWPQRKPPAWHATEKGSSCTKGQSTRLT